MASPRLRFFPQPYRIDGSRGWRSGTAGGSSSVFDSDGEADPIQLQPQQHQQQQQAGPSSSRPPMFTSDLGPPAPPERFNKDGSENVEWARYHSTLRLKSKWDSIYERYKDAHLVEQDEILFAPSSSLLMKGRRAGQRTQAGRKRKRGRRRRRKFGHVSSDDDSAESSPSDFDDDADSASDSEASSSRTPAIQVIKNRGTLEGLGGKLHFGSFIKDEELDALKAVMNEEGGSSSSPPPPSSDPQAPSSRAPIVGIDSQSEVEFDSDDDEIGGWGEMAFIRPQYPEFEDELGGSADHGDEHAADSPPTSRKYDPDLAEFLLAEQRRRNECSDSDESDSDVIDFAEEWPSRPGAPSNAVVAAAAAEPRSEQIMDDVEYCNSSTDDEMDTLKSPARSFATTQTSPRRRGLSTKKHPAAPTPKKMPTPQPKPKPKPEPEPEPPSATSTTTRKANPPPLHNKKARINQPTTTTTIIPAFEDAQRAKRTAVEVILARWTREQDAYLAQLDEDALYRFDLGIARLGPPVAAVVGHGAGPTAGKGVRVEVGSALDDVFDSLPASFRGIPGLEALLKEHS